MDILSERYKEKNNRMDCKPDSNGEIERYLFLDIDGVLDTNRYCNYLIDQDEDDYDEDGTIFDPEAVENLKIIMDNVPNLKIVISSSWRFKGWKWMNDLWARRKMPGKIFEMTPGLEKVSFYTDFLQLGGSYSVIPYGTRGLEIYEWLRNNAGHNPLTYEYVIIDDNTVDFLLIQKDHLINTNPWDGLTKEVAVKAIEKLL